jgi:hypothetical protein
MMPGRVVALEECLPERGETAVACLFTAGTSDLRHVRSRTPIDATVIRDGAR